MNDPILGTEETQLLGFLLHKHPTAEDIQERQQYPAMERVSNYIAGLHLSNGQVLVDNFAGCIPYVILMSPNPKVWVIPNDRKFQRTLADPLTFNAHYILDNEPSGTGALAATNSSYPELWKTGAGFAKLVHYIPADGPCPAFKLFKVTGHPNI